MQEESEIMHLISITKRHIVHDILLIILKVFEKDIEEMLG